MVVDAFLVSRSPINECLQSLLTRVNEDEGVTKKKDGLLTHYEFRKAVAMYWINPEETMRHKRSLHVPTEVGRNTNKRRFNAMRSPTSLSDLTGMSTDSLYMPSLLNKRRAASCTDNALAENGELRCRMDQTLDHYPVKAAPKVKCGMH